ncbi:nitroreductase family protein [Halodesulfovibrio marinisediminis]|uniref:Nitroreductase n=1 Tax=Halodesulfovibrio marinisediminis DSM 17456 TaxID=1121457 RepID=A0A1N6DH39_9BACT|nr:nitroreductase family protein [Halodesulfovibrio marinisediminis]SIN70078.1 Nitroreductase [Halodesulfovibrio marinisediminis DSM 17456]
MSFYSVDQTKCKKCLICAEVCPNKLILKDKETGIPKIRIGGEASCLQCGHCVAVCPVDCVKLEPMPSENFTPINKPLAISTEQADQFLRTRRSIRAFKSKPVDHETLQEIVALTNYAPSASHKQPVQWIMVESPELVRELAEMTIEWMTDLRKNNRELAKKYSVAGLIAGWKKGQDLILRGAPHLAISYTEKGNTWNNTDSAIALSYLELAAHSRGVGACFAGFFTYCANAYMPLRERLGLQENHICCGGHMLGYAKFSYPRIPMRKKLSVNWL